jgi:hypothetical protein
MRSRLLSLLVATVLALTAARASAAILYGATGGSAVSDLYVIDQNTGAAVSVGSIGYAVTGLAFNPTTGVLYGSTSRLSSVAPESIITIDLSTGAGTLVGATQAGPLADIAFSSSGTLYGWSEGSDGLVTVNLGTGNAATVGNFGQFTRGSGLEFDATGTLYSAGRIEGFLDGALHIVNPATGASAGTLNTGPDPTQPVNSLAYDPVSGLLYGSLRTSQLVSIDLANGAITTIGASVTGLDALAFQPSAAVPEPGTLTIFCLGGLGLALGAVRRRFRK